MCARPVGMNLFFGTVLIMNRGDLRKGMATSRGARAVRFLTGGYRNQVFYWELVELFRRLTVSGWVRFCVCEHAIHWSEAFYATLLRLQTARTG